MDPLLITPVVGFEVEILTRSDPAVGLSLRIAVSGWEWWLLVGFCFQLNNTAAVTAAVPTMLLDNGTIPTIAGGAGNAAVASGNSRQIVGGPGAGMSAVGTTVHSMAFPWVPVIGEGNVQFGFSGGDAATQISSCRATIIGRRKRHRRPGE